MGKIAYAAFNPSFKVKGIKVALDPLDMVAIPVEKLGPVVDSLTEQRQAISAALNELLRRVWK